MQNGEIFNHAMLREGLERDGFSFRSRCDTEVLPALYARTAWLPASACAACSGSVSGTAGGAAA